MRRAASILSVALVLVAVALTLYAFTVGADKQRYSPDCDYRYTSPGCPGAE
jgi:hypothetical protein